MVTTIRRATPADARALAELRYEFRAEVGVAVESRQDFVDRCAAWMAPRLSRGRAWTAWLVECDGVVAGQIWLQTIEKLPNPVSEPERWGYVSNLYVRPEARGGVGRRLLEVCLAFMEAEEFDRAVLWPTLRSRPLYARHGFLERDDLLERRFAR